MYFYIFKEHFYMHKYVMTQMCYITQNIKIVTDVSGQ